MSTYETALASRGDPHRNRTYCESRFQQVVTRRPSPTPTCMSCRAFSPHRTVPTTRHADHRPRVLTATPHFVSRRRSARRILRLRDRLGSGWEAQLLRLCIPLAELCLRVDVAEPPPVQVPACIKVGRLHSTSTRSAQQSVVMVTLRARRCCCANKCVHQREALSQTLHAAPVCKA